MIRGLAPAATVVWFVALSVIIGASALLSEAAADSDEGRELRVAIPAAALTALLAGAWVLLARAIELSGASSVEAVRRLALETRFGHVWCFGESAIGLALLFGVFRESAHRAALAAAYAALVAQPLASHSASAGGSPAAVAAHALHLLSLSFWVGGLLALVWLFARARIDPVRTRRAAELLSGFSRRAPLWVAALAASGVWIASVHVGTWPALLGTRYGALLLAKLALLAAALGVAAVLRLRILPAWTTARQEATATAPLLSATTRRLTAELSLATAAIGVAAILAETIPGAHDVVSWWLPFRFSLRATWPLPWVAERSIGGGMIAVCYLAVAAGRLASGRWRSGLGVGGLGLALAAAVALPAIAVPAYPSTYWRPEVPYEVTSVVHGKELYREHCTSCHGDAGRGDGPLGRSLPKRPADLTQPHTADHTAGDMYWWLTYGIPASGMPRYDEVLASDDRWDLINYLRAFASGYQARLLSSRIAPKRPWIGAIDFDFTTIEGRHAVLRDYRERAAVVLVLFTPGGSDARLAELRKALPEIRARGTELLTVPLLGKDASLSALAPLPVIADEADKIAPAYMLFRRTFDSPGNERDDDVVPHLELLIDRFGYLRARWRPDVEPTGWSAPSALLTELESLAREPKILPPPDDHVH